ncbi:histone deacetylase HDT2-like, partial [Miscanthus floridulus]|uniref:histone deacetylase HDT2-like n=1 Tax=Miscanthus floridulus TaxID=154761 RepID=UPI003457ED14
YIGKEVKPGATFSCKVSDDLVIHLSQAALGEPKKASENVIVSVKIDDKKLVLGTLSVEKHPQISCDLVFDKDFELSHNSKIASVFFCCYKSPVPQFESYSGEDSSDEELETNQIPRIEISVAKVPVKGGTKVESSSSDDDDDFTDSESDSEMSNEDDSSDEDEVSSGADPSDDSSDDSGSEEQTPTPKKTNVVVGKKRAIQTEAPFGKKAKSEQSAQKTGDKKVSTHSAKQSSKTPTDKSTKTPTADKKSPKSISHACKSCNKSFSSASGLESHQKAKKHEA